MNRLIPIINKLQDVFATVGSQPIDLPQIAVVGSQSVGKSSVLENIVGHDFLPRGSNIVTRRPLILQLFTIESGQNANGDDSKQNDSNDKVRPYGEFLHSGSKRFYDFSEIRTEIEKETERVAPNKAISYEPINLKIYSPNVLNLTLIDLPGMTKVAVANQPPDIERRIRKLIRSFISRPRCLILAVSAATSDLATSDAIQLAKEVDPKGLRTLGVITKIDLMDKGTNALDILKGNIIPLQLGYIGVVNRSQKDINDNKLISDAIKSEEMFFKTHASYRGIAHVCGIAYLSYKLNQILINHIKKCLPELRQSINENINALELELIGYGKPVALDNEMNHNKGALLLHLISKFAENFSDSIDGSGNNLMSLKKNRIASAIDGLLSSSQARELFGGARILYIFRTEFTHNLNKIKPFDGLSDDFILNSMRNASGIRSSLFIPEMCFENLVKMQIEKLRRPCLQCVDLVFAELKRIASQSETTEIARFTQFRDALHLCVTSMLKRHLEPSRMFVNQVIDIELAYVNTNHPDFISMDDVFTERANHSSQSGMYSQILSDRDQAQQYQSHLQKQSHNNPQKQSHLKRAPAPDPPNNNDSNQNVQSQQKEKGSFLWWGKGANNNENSKDNHESKSNDSKSKKHSNKPPPQAQVNGPNKGNRASKTNKVSPPNQRSSKKGRRSSLMEGFHLKQSNNATQREQLELLVIKRFIKSYFEICKKNISDLVPKSIMFMLVNKSKQRLQQDLALSLYKEAEFEKLLSESPEISQKRKAALELVQILRKALQIINQVNDYRL